MLSIHNSSFPFEQLEKELKLIEYQNKLVEEYKNQKRYFRLYLKIVSNFIQRTVNYFRVYQLNNLVQKVIESDYDEFLKIDERGKEDIVLRWGKVSNEASIIIYSTMDTSSIKTDWIAFRIFKILTLIQDFEKRIKKELYGDLENRSYTQAELEAMAAKFKDFPKEILEDRSSDKYSKKYL